MTEGRAEDGGGADDAGFCATPVPAEHGSWIGDVKERIGTLAEHRVVGKGIRPGERRSDRRDFARAARIG
jgi:hypothetical protein